MKTTPVPAALAATLLLVSGCGKPKDQAVPFDEDDPAGIGIADEDLPPEALSRDGTSKPSAYDTIRTQLRENGIRPGYDEEKELLVAVAKANAVCLDPCSDKGFADLRSECLDLALKNARRDILEWLTIRDSAAADDGATALGTIVQRADGVLSGAAVLLSAESWRKGEYEVAAAVVSSPKLMQDITNRRIGKETEPGIPGKHSLREWLDTQDFSVTQGPRSFVDDTGERHYLGIGAADAKAATGAALRLAQTKAQAQATKYAAFPFPTRIHSKITIRQSLLRDADGNLSADENLDEEYTEEPVAVPREIQVVLQTEAVHPISGRKMAVVIVEAIP